MFSFLIVNCLNSLIKNGLKSRTGIKSFKLPHIESSELHHDGRIGHKMELEMWHDVVSLTCPLPHSAQEMATQLELKVLQSWNSFSSVCYPDGHLQPSS